MTTRSDKRGTSWIVALWPYAASTLLVVLAALGGLALRAWIDPPNVSMVFLAAVLVSAVAFGLWPSLYAASLGTFAYNFFFLDPLYSLTVSDPANVVALVFLLIVAVFTSDLTARLRTAVENMRQGAQMTEALYEFSRKLTGIARIDDLLWATAHQMAMMLKARVILMLPSDGTLQVAGGYPPDDRLSAADLEAAQLAWLGSRITGRGTGSASASDRLFLPMRSVEGPVGVIGIDRDWTGEAGMFDTDERRLLEALADQAGIAIARALLANVAEKARVAAEREDLRLALLSAISHDFRTPLASIIGSASSLRSLGDRFDAATRTELLDTIRQEAERLNRFVGNVLDMTRIEGGALRPKLVAVDLSESLNSAIDDLRPHLGEHRVELSCPDDLPMLRLDPILFRHVIGNLLDNAAKFSPAGTRVEITARQVDDSIVVQITDEGPGLNQSDLTSIFDRFYRVRDNDRRRAGNGLGLAICRGFVVAMGGSIAAANRTDRSGAVFTLSWPVTSQLNPPYVDD